MDISILFVEKVDIVTILPHNLILEFRERGYF